MKTFPWSFCYRCVHNIGDCAMIVAMYFFPRVQSATVGSKDRRIFASGHLLSSMPTSVISTTSTIFRFVCADPHLLLDCIPLHRALFLMHRKYHVVQLFTFDIHTTSGLLFVTLFLIVFESVPILLLFSHLHI